jgi:non-ribosomal peptide synthetase component E (peptide arylation enzyme)
LRTFAGQQLAHHKLPEGLVVVDELPLTPMEKVDKRALQARLDHSAPADGSAPPG